MKTLTITPHGWPCKLIDCPAGLFVFKGSLGFKSEYFQSDPDSIQVYCADSGEIFWGGASSKAARAELVVQPAILEWSET